jgi:hypothetical protein
MLSRAPPSLLATLCVGKPASVLLNHNNKPYDFILKANQEVLEVNLYRLSQVFPSGSPAEAGGATNVLVARSRTLNPPVILGSKSQGSGKPAILRVWRPSVGKFDDNAVVIKTVKGSQGLKTGGSPAKNTGAENKVSDFSDENDVAPSPQLRGQLTDRSGSPDTVMTDQPSAEPDQDSPPPRRRHTEVIDPMNFIEEDRISRASENLLFFPDQSPGSFSDSRAPPIAKTRNAVSLPPRSFRSVSTLSAPPIAKTSNYGPLTSRPVRRLLNSRVSATTNSNIQPEPNGVQFDQSENVRFEFIDQDDNTVVPKAFKYCNTAGTLVAQAKVAGILRPREDHKVISARTSKGSHQKIVQGDDMHFDALKEMITKEVSTMARGEAENYHVQIRVCL